MFEDMYVLANEDVSIVVGEKTYVFETGNVYFFSAQELMEIYLTDPTAAQTFMGYVQTGTFEVVFLENADQYVLAHETVETLGRIFEEGNVYFVSKEELDADLTGAYYFAQYVSEGILEQVEHIVVNVFVKDSFWFGKQYLYKYSYYTLDTYDYIYDPILASGVIEPYDSENDEGPVSVYALKSFSESITGLSMYEGEYRMVKLKNGFATYNGVMQDLVESGYIVNKKKPRYSCDLVNILIKNETTDTVSIFGACSYNENTDQLDFLPVEVPRESTREISIPMSGVDPFGNRNESYYLYIAQHGSELNITPNYNIGSLRSYGLTDSSSDKNNYYFYRIYYKPLWQINSGYVSGVDEAEITIQKPNS